MTDANDLRAHLERLDAEGRLVRVTRPINKDTELHPLVRWQFRSDLPENQRKGFLFENVIDSSGKRYQYPVAVGVLASNPAIYAVGMQCELSEVPARWKQALSNPIEAVLVESGPVHEVVLTGDALDAAGEGLDAIPIPISTPGFDNAPYSTCSHWITKDIDTGIRNVGNYRGQIKGSRKVGCYNQGGQHFTLHLDKCRKKGVPMDAALVIGPPPAVSYAAVQKVPYGVDELAIAGGLLGEPIPLVRCKTVDIEVPAYAELVIEGRVNPDWLEPEGPFGESHGHMHPRELSPFLEVTAITHRKDMIYLSFISQVTPSESSVIKKLGYEPMLLSFIRDSVGLSSVVAVNMHEPMTNLRKVIVVKMKNPSQPEVWRALSAVTTFHQGVGKLVIAVDADIDITDMDAVLWAISYRCKPHEDMQILHGREKGHAPPFHYMGGTTEERVQYHEEATDSCLLINATLKTPFPPVSLPKQPYMERALEIWKELGLPEVRPKYPWYGYSLGQWDTELEEEAELAVQGKHHLTGDKLAQRRVKV